MYGQGMGNGVESSKVYTVHVWSFWTCTSYTRMRIWRLTNDFQFDHEALLRLGAYLALVGPGVRLAYFGYLQTPDFGIVGMDNPETAVLDERRVPDGQD